MKLSSILIAVGFIVSKIYAKEANFAFSASDSIKDQVKVDHHFGRNSKEALLHVNFVDKANIQHTLGFVKFEIDTPNACYNLDNRVAELYQDRNNPFSFFVNDKKQHAPANHKRCSSEEEEIETVAHSKRNAR